MRRLLAILIVALWAGTVAAESYVPRVGQRHPEIRLPEIGSGQAVPLSELRGGKVLLIHFASW